MLTLYLTRHAKSSKEDPTQRDFDRPLNERGLRDAPFMAGVFAKRGEQVDLLISSPANRAISTAQCFFKALALPADRFKTEERIYLADPGLLRKVLAELPAHAHSVMLFGHNPGFSMLADALTQQASGELSTCSTVRIDLALDSWAEVLPGSGSLAWIDFPKQHAEL